MADQKLVGEIKGQLNRNRNDLLTAKGARNNALSQSSAPNLSDKERAKFRDLYKEFDSKIKKLEKERKDLEKQLNQAQANVPTYNKKEGEKETQLIKDQYDLLVSSYSALSDKTGADAKSIKKRMDDLAVEFQKAYTKSVGTPVSLAVAKAKLKGTDLSAKKPEEPITLEATKTAEQTATQEAKAKSAASTATKTTGSTTGPTPTSTAGAKPFTEPMTISGQVSTVGAPSGAKQPSKFEDLIKRTEFWYNLPDYIFKVNPKLQEILVKAVDEGWTDERFLAAAQQTPWWQQNSASIRTRIVDKAKYDELRAQGLDVSKTDYALDSRSIRSRIKGIAQQKGANLSEEQLDQIVSQAYNGFLENDTNALTQLIAPYIGMVPAILKGAPGVTSTSGITSTYSGEALKNYQTLQDIARQNGFKLQDILPNISTATTAGNLENAVLQRLATGDLDVNAIAQNARMLAAAGQPQYVRDLLNQGYDLSQIYSPYRTIMSKVLEINPDQIDLNDPTLRAGITDKGDLNLYEYQKALRKDNRWQYTEQANTEVSNSVKQVLQDFGFMG